MKHILIIFSTLFFLFGCEPTSNLEASDRPVITQIRITNGTGLNWASYIAADDSGIQDFEYLMTIGNLKFSLNEFEKNDTTSYHPINPGTTINEVHEEYSYQYFNPSSTSGISSRDNQNLISLKQEVKVESGKSYTLVFRNHEDIYIIEE